MKFLLILFLAFNVSAQVVQIKVGKDYNKYSNKDLRKRIWNLERAVRQLQRRVFQLEKDEPTEAWVCTIKGLKGSFSETGISKAVAKKKVMDACKSADSGSDFFCKTINCEQ